MSFPATSIIRAFTRKRFLKIRNEVTKRFGTKRLSFPAKKEFSSQKHFPSNGD
ncbi:hypothetical protein HanRHA438_Chr04g0153761 [Helianthus annuus]|nr:hypothetical protein HanRHA438_Chr04g0153761 [Helianthus annuus]